MKLFSEGFQAQVLDQRVVRNGLIGPEHGTEATGIAESNSFAIAHLQVEMIMFLNPLGFYSPQLTANIW
ncbi:MAG: hypothetical protein KZQ60_07150 [Candidatus Thiodiazotropha sp. (ex Lucinoma aequizonata)]|nr:hypothetical protein [Candidatus Thiodiazotropha sp. (ex Lucinoma aequizonata)]MCU7894438.1 hypothetical protein [Candidatus Thiodiazotropha sp. (ex Lucinoma aequizonata)]